MEIREAIEWLEGCVVSYEIDNKGRPNGYVTCDLTQEVVDMAISALEKQETERWIPLTEKLPEEDCECRVTEDNGYSKYVIDCNWSNRKKQFEVWSDYNDCYIQLVNVTAWKLKEEPYTEEEA